ncbi:MAG: urease accessory protein UreH domain-containing protein [Patescibacteria group bacterium]
MSHNKYIKIPIKGMHCRSCEILIEDKLKEVSRVKSAELNYKTGEATIYYHGEEAPQKHLLNEAITDAGYEIGRSEELPFFSRNGQEYYNLGIAFLVLMILYFGLNLFGLTSINLSPDLNSPSFGIIILIGLVAGFSTCMAMVGGLSLGLSTKFAENHPSATPAEKFRPHIFFVLGRVLGYALLGGILGMLGTVLKFSPLVNGIITLAVGLVMLIMGLQLINIFPRLSKFKLTLPKNIARIFGISRKNKEYSHKNSMMLGALTFFLPCGFTQAMQLYAISTGSFSSGAFIMGMFALGTAPGLLSIGGVTSLVRGSFKEGFFKVAGLAVIFFALFNLNNGYTLASINIGNLSSQSSSSEATNSDPNVTLENGVQVVRMTEGNSGYSPNKFSIKKGVPVKWIIDAKAPYSCASSIIVPSLNISKTLKAGENIIEFTPDKVGRIPFSCSMGMYTGVFNVYDGSAPISGVNTALADSKAAPAPRAGGSCGGGGGGCGCGGGAKKPINTNATPVIAKTTQDNSNNEAVQIIKTTYTAANYLDPSVFKVKAGVKVRLEIDVRDDGTGCGYAIMIPGLYDNAKPLQAGVPIVMEFTPTTPGSYDITCSMNMIRYGSISVE